MNQILVKNTNILNYVFLDYYRHFTLNINKKIVIYFLLSLCQPENTSCQDQVWTNFLSRNLSCLTKECPLECNHTHFQLFTSLLRLSGEYLYSDYINENKILRHDFDDKFIDASKASVSIAKVYVYYKTLTYELSNETPAMDWISLVATMGGTLSLFMGVSVFSLFEIVEFLMEVILEKLCLSSWNKSFKKKLTPTTNKKEVRFW